MRIEWDPPRSPDDPCPALDPAFARITRLEKIFMGEHRRRPEFATIYHDGKRVVAAAIEDGPRIDRIRPLIRVFTAAA